MLAAITPFLLFSAFLLLLLVTLSTPIIHSIFLFKITAHASSSILDSSANGKVRFGVWGYCVSNLQAKVVGISENTDAFCSPKKLGYTFDDRLMSALGIDHISNLISKALTAALVLHPIACALTFVALFFSLFMLHRSRTGGVDAGSRVASLLTFFSAFLAALITTVVFLIDVILVAVVRHRVHKDSDGVLTLSWGNAVWMALGATVALWLSLLGSCAGIFAIRRQRKAAGTY
ncbi:pali-domain-containing protein [Punctularia strigosozonata HHB-11173 SS5]|uniref:pali-domain-containing protein n=1 Tax=Punctularia strigosozonata (strain HHB-11173) TaxID=741275 RepID=UPI0004416ECB|nr:pali-domain-containing protein [Punctularia strigosozonata HHB-11173 SS5]EIN07466.1 pali-domain-containing protein [Punctularia strigosozonata HHB-11173 SS5]